jgi:hypothetical protein
VAGGNIQVDAGYGIRCSDNFRLYDATNSIDRFLFSSNNIYNTRNSGSHVFQHNGSQTAVLSSSGNMGIGVASPTCKLDVTGSTGGSGYSLLVRSGETSGGTSAIQIALGYGGTSDYRHAIRTRHNASAAANNAIDFWLWQQGVDAVGTVGSLRAMTIDGANGGSVGIGTPSPGSKLDVKGTLRLSGSSSGYVGFAPAAAAGSTTYTLPSADGISGQVLSTNGSGLLSWATVSGSISDGDKGDITVSSSGTVWTIDNSVVTLAKMANLAANSIIGNNTGSPATPLALTGTQVTAMLDAFTSGAKGLAPASGGGTANFLRADGTWAAPPGSGAYTVYSPTTTTSVTETSGEVIVLADATSGNLTVNLPTAVANTAKITVKKIDSSANTVIIDGNTTQTIDGSLTKTIEFQYTSVSLISNGSNWFIV